MDFCKPFIKVVRVLSTAYCSQIVQAFLSAKELSHELRPVRKKDQQTHQPNVFKDNATVPAKIKLTATVTPNQCFRAVERALFLL